MSLYRMIYLRDGKPRGRTFTSHGPQSAYEQAQRWCWQSQQWTPDNRMHLLTVTNVRRTAQCTGR